jgi:hydroxyacylglutathione hydrolase
LQIKVHFTPCHTRGHVLYEILDTDQPNKSHAIFTGDTLFIGGCGRFFEGTAQEMYHALIEVLGKMPQDTLIYCGHEYTEKNLEFAKTLEPNNEKLREKLAWVKQQRANQMPTIPSTIGEELTYNPFMRVNQKTIMDVVGQTDPVEVMREVRARKDHF